jgi:hypothetical protein
VITLGIETSCDETAIAIVEDGFSVRTNLIARQEHLHERYGGVVPEVAARAHVESLNPLLERSSTRASGSGAWTAWPSPSGRGWSALCLWGWRPRRPSPCRPARR